MNGLAIGMTLTHASGPSVARVDVLSATITHDPLRVPQITADLQTPITTLGLDPLSRDPVHLVITARGDAVGTLRDFDAAAPPATLGALEWSDKASTATSHDAGPPRPDRTYELQLFCTSIVQDQGNGTATVTLSSADFMLDELKNAGPAWTPARDPDGTWRLKSVLRQLLQRLKIPLDVPAGPEGDRGIFNEDMQPWETGESALSWLEELRTAYDVTWMLSATARTIQPSYDSGAFNWYWDDALEVQAERGTEVSDITGQSRWCDGYLLIWTWSDDAGEHVVRDFASEGGRPWTDCRKILTERHNRPPTSLTAQKRLERAQLYRFQASVSVPMTALPEPYLDLVTWAEARGHLTQLTYTYPQAIAAVTLIGV